MTVHIKLRVGECCESSAFERSEIINILQWTLKGGAGFGIFSCFAVLHEELQWEGKRSLTPGQ